MSDSRFVACSGYLRVVVAVGAVVVVVGVVDGIFGIGVTVVLMVFSNFANNSIL